MRFSHNAVTRNDRNAVSGKGSPEGAPNNVFLKFITHAEKDIFPCTIDHISFTPTQRDSSPLAERGGGGDLIGKEIQFETFWQ